MRKWIVRGAILAALLVAAAGVAGWMAAKRFEPFVREQAIAYLESRFGTGVELATMKVSVRFLSPWHPRAARLRVSGTGLKLPPLISVAGFQVDTNLGELWDAPRRIREVRLEGLEIDVPPREQRSPGRPAKPGTGPGAPSVLVDTIHATGSTLRIHAADPAKLPRTFEIESLTLKGAGAGVPLHYDALLHNPTPPGRIQAAGSFGPWQRDDSGESPISGEYTFTNADLGVFKGIAGILSSTGHFDGVLRRIAVHGETQTPQFRLAGGNPVPLTTRFDSIVDGTTGDTLLQPVRATLGSTQLEARGRVIRPEGAKARSVALDVIVKNGRIEDFVRLAVKAPKPFLTGDVALRTKMQMLPAPGAPIAEKLLLDGGFEIERSAFSGGSVQAKVDELSRRGQGQPANDAISDVLSAMRGEFQLRDGELRLPDLVFQTPGAAIHLHGSYGLYSEAIDLHGVARLQAKASQTMSGWKRVLLKPVDPLLSKAGAGTLLPIKVTGTRSAPQFGLDRGHKPDFGSADRANASRR